MYLEYKRLISILTIIIVTFNYNRIAMCLEMNLIEYILFICLNSRLKSLGVIKKYEYF